MIVLFREVAESELGAIWQRYAEIDPELGDRFLAQVDAALQRAAENPLSYQVLEADIRHVRMRRFPHALYFRVGGYRPLLPAVGATEWFALASGGAGAVAGCVARG